LDAELLLGHCLGMSRTELYLHAKDTISDKSFTQFEIQLNRRVQREPIAYILGVQEFWGLDFIVTPDVLIPRPETEQLLEKVIAFDSAGQIAEGLIVDLCCGSGVIAIILARELK
jgi:release factor glutamine methyltransferase